MFQRMLSSGALHQQLVTFERHVHRAIYVLYLVVKDVYVYLDRLWLVIFIEIEGFVVLRALLCRRKPQLIFYALIKVRRHRRPLILTCRNHLNIDRIMIDELPRCPVVLLRATKRHRLLLYRGLRFLPRRLLLLLN